MLSADASPDEERITASVAAKTQMTLLTGSPPSIEIPTAIEHVTSRTINPTAARATREGRRASALRAGVVKNTHMEEGQWSDYRVESPRGRENSPIRLRAWANEVPDRLIVLRQCNIRCDHIRTGKAAMKIGA